MLEVGRAGKSLGKSPVVLADVVDRVDFQRLSAAPAVPLIARDAFVADVAIKLDQLRIEMGSVSRELHAAREEMRELRDDADRTQRFVAFRDNEQRAHSAKFEDVSRRLKDVKERVDRLDCRNGGNFHGYNSLEAVSVKLTELSELQRQFRSVDQKLKLSAGLFCASVLMWMLAVLA